MRTSWMLLLDWGVVLLTLVSAGASALAALIAFHQDDTSAMAEAALAFFSALCAAWLGRQASRAAKRWQEELVSWHANDIVLLADAHGRILDANDRAAEAYGRESDTLFHRSLQELCHPTAAEDGDARIRALLADGRALYESVHRRADGGPFPVEVSARVLSANGQPLLHLIVRDVTEPHRARRQLVAAERLAAVGAVSAAMAHDINNPLSGVLGNLTYAVDALGEPIPDVREVRLALEEARDSAVRVRDIVRDLNAFANGFGEAEGPALLGDAIESAVGAERTLLGGRCRVAVDVPARVRTAAPMRRLSYLFRSLLRGAALAMPEGAPGAHQIRVVLGREEPGRLVVEVRDDGPPIHAYGTPVPAAPVPGTTQVGRSAGAGLAAVMGMVRAVGGDVTVLQEPGWNVVRVTLPSAPPDPRREEPRAGPHRDVRSDRAAVTPAGRRPD